MQKFCTALWREKGEGANAHLMIGPYGTGKSLLAAILCQFLAKSFGYDWSNSLLTQAQQIDGRLAVRLSETFHTPITYLPVAINGRTGSLRNIVNFAIHRALLDQGINVRTPNEAQSILDTVDRWRREYPDTYAMFLSHLLNRNWTESEWSELISHYEEEALRDFIAFYPTVTAGTAWSVNHEAFFSRIWSKLPTNYKNTSLDYLLSMMSLAVFCNHSTAWMPSLI